MAAVHAGRKRDFAQTLDDDSSNGKVQDVHNSDHSTAVIEQSLGNGIADPNISLEMLPEGAAISSFESDASILLIGIRGVGKSSLAILAATAYDRTVVEFDRVFLDASGLAPTAYRKTYGSLAFQQFHAHLLRDTLSSHDRNSVIVCSFADVEGKGAAIIKKFAQTHPVIHVMRDHAGLQADLKVWPEERITQLMQASRPLLQFCSNFDYFNLTEHGANTVDGANGRRHHRTANGVSKVPFLTLKRAERDFLKMLRNVLGDHSRGPSHQSAYPLSQVPVEERSYTYSARISVQDILTGAIDLDAAQIGADVFELVVDDTKGTVIETTEEHSIAKAFAILRRSTILPVVLTVDNDDIRVSFEDADKCLAEMCLRLGPEYVTMSLNASERVLVDLLSRRGRTKAIGAKAMQTRPPRGWLDESCYQAFEQGKRVGCDVVKIHFPAESNEDCFSVHAFRQHIESQYDHPKLGVYCTGDFGRPSWCFNKVLQPVNLPGLGASLARMLYISAMQTTTDLTRALYATCVLESLRFYIYGANTKNSLSPPMHNAAYKACGMPHSYETVSSPTLDRLLNMARSPTFGGAAITQPFKTSIISKLDALSAHAQAIGAINTMIPIRRLTADGNVPEELGIITQRNQQGQVKALYGHNTDWIGIRACLRRGLSPANTVRPHSTGLVCGAGGMARAAVYSLLSLGVRHIFICNRTLANARAIADHYNRLLSLHSVPDVVNTDTEIHVIESFEDAWPAHHRQPTMIVVCIPAQPADGSPPTNFTVPDQWLKSPTGGVVLELAYRPLLMPLVRQMEDEAGRGWILMDGFDVMPEQAFAQFELFTGRRAPRKVMREEAMRRYRQELASDLNVSLGQQG